MKSIKQISDWLIIALFSCVLLSSFLFWSLRPDLQFSENEKRPLATFPEMNSVKNAVDYLQKFDVYYQDHFGFREWMAYRYQREVSRRFGESGNPMVVKGKTGWLFNTMNGVLEDYQGKLRFSEEELDRLCQGLQAKHDWFARQGILYIPFVAPNKQSIYGDKLKDSYRALKGKKTRYDQVLESCDNALLYDLRPVLKEQGVHERLYAKSDTHWNYKGALLAYYYLMETIQTAFPEFTYRKEFTFAENLLEKTGGDLALMLGREDIIKESWPVLADKLPIKTALLSPILQEYLSLPKLKVRLYHVDPSAKRLLVLRDSFFNAVTEFTAINFSEFLSIWQFYDEETLEISGPHGLLPIVEDFKPDIVIEEIVERNLEWLIRSVDHDWSSVK